MTHPSDPLVVIGAGTAGLVLSITAAEHGRPVLLVEKTRAVGGTIGLSGGKFSAAGTELQRSRGIDDGPEGHLADVRRISGDAARTDLVAQIVDEAGPLTDWLASRGFQFAPECPGTELAHEPYSVARMYWGTDQGRSLLAVLEQELRRSIDRGLVTLAMGAEVLELQVEGDGARRAVSGVRYIDGNGTERTQTSSTVVLCTGGYSASASMFSRLHGGRPLVSAGAVGSTGDGHRMVEELGGVIVGADHWIPTFGGLPGPDDPTRVRWNDRPILQSAKRPPWEIYVGRDGRRFVAEDAESVAEKEHALAELPDLTFFMVFDAAGLTNSQPMVAGWSIEDLRAAAGRRRGIEAASSIEELAQKSGIDASALTVTIEEYNSAVADGVDPRFGRRHLPAPIAEAPFYAVQNHGITLSTYAGVHVDDEFTVTTSDGETIGGLYGAGEVLGAASYMGRGRAGGMSLTAAMAAGRLLGRRLAANA